MDRGSMSCNKASRENCKKKPKERHEDQQNLRIKIRNTTDACEKRNLKDRLKLLKELKQTK